MISDVLQEDHRRVGKLIEGFLESVRKGEPDTEAFTKARRRLHNHIFWEESVLFRKVETPGNAIRIHGLEVEHGGIWKLLEKIWEYVQNGEADLAVDRLEGLLRVLDTHNTAEESTVYSELEKEDSATQAQMLLFEVEHASAPEDWVCSILRRYRR